MEDRWIPSGSFSLSILANHLMTRVLAPTKTLTENDSWTLFKVRRNARRKNDKLNLKSI